MEKIFFEEKMKLSMTIFSDWDLVELKALQLFLCQACESNSLKSESNQFHVKNLTHPKPEKMHTGWKFRVRNNRFDK